VLHEIGGKPVSVGYLPQEWNPWGQEPKSGCLRHFLMRWSEDDNGAGEWC